MSTNSEWRVRLGRCPGQCFWFGRVVVQKPRTKADTRLAHSNGNHVRHHGWHMRNVRPIAEDELQRVLTFWQGDHGFGLSRPEMQVMIISWNWLF